MLGCLGALAACGEAPSPKTEAEVRAHYAGLFLEGVDYGLSGRIKAGSIDPATNDLLDVKIEEIGSRIMHADRGEIIVDARNDTVSLRLVGVTSADTESGALATAPMYLTEEIELGYDVRE